MTDVNQNKANGKAGFTPGFSAEAYAKSQKLRQDRAAMRKSGELFTLEMDGGGEVNLVEIGAGRNGKGQAVSFAYSTRRNKHGMFLGCRVVHRAHGEVVRDKWVTGRRRSVVEGRARARAATFEEKALTDRPAKKAA